MVQTILTCVPNFKSAIVHQRIAHSHQFIGDLLQLGSPSDPSSNSDSDFVSNTHKYIKPKVAEVKTNSKDSTHLPRTRRNQDNSEKQQSRNQNNSDLEHELLNQSQAYQAHCETQGCWHPLLRLGGRGGQSRTNLPM